MTAKTVKLTSYDVPQNIKDTINAMQTIEEVEAYRNGVKSPNQCEAGDPDLTIWWACASVLQVESDKARQEAESKNRATPTEKECRLMEWVLSDEYDNL